ncbi:MAG: hypothetical protein ABIH39_05730 [Candidatus Margulisiibacteriota bacterium]
MAINNIQPGLGFQSYNSINKNDIENNQPQKTDTVIAIADSNKSISIAVSPDPNKTPPAVAPGLNLADNAAKIELSTALLEDPKTSTEAWTEGYNGLRTIKRVLFHSLPLKEKGPWSRLAYLGGHGMLSIYFNWGFGTVLHEIHHAAKAKSYGFEPEFCITNGQKDISPFRLALAKLLFQGKAYTNTELKTETVDHLKADGVFDEAMARIAQAGINGNTLFANSLIQEAQKNEFLDVSEVIYYMWNKLYGAAYTRVSMAADDGPDKEANPGQKKGDIDRAIESVKAQGFYISKEDIYRHQRLTTLCSGGFLTFMLKAMPSYVLKGEKGVEPLHIKLGGLKVYWPEFSTFLNPGGISLNTQVGLRFDPDTYLSLGFETLTTRSAIDKSKVDKSSEISIGINKDFNKYGLSAELTANDKGGRLFGLGGYRDLAKHFRLGANISYGKNDTYKELRECAHPYDDNGPFIEGKITTAYLF